MEAKLILHPTDGSESADKALDYAAQLAVGSNAKLLVLYVQALHGTDNVPPALAEFARVENIHLTEADVLREAAEALVAKVENAARAKGVRDVETITMTGDPAHVILDVAKDRKVDTIVMGSRGLGSLQGLLLGAVAYKVAHMAPCTSIIVR